MRNLKTLFLATLICASAPSKFFASGFGDEFYATDKWHTITGKQMESLANTEFSGTLVFKEKYHTQTLEFKNIILETGNNVGSAIQAYCDITPTRSLGESIVGKYARFVEVARSILNGRVTVNMHELYSNSEMKKRIDNMKTLKLGIDNALKNLAQVHLNAIKEKEQQEDARIQQEEEDFILAQMLAKQQEAEELARQQAAEELEKQQEIERLNEEKNRRRQAAADAAQARAQKNDEYKSNDID
jgi:hypothetical protein